MANEFIIKHGFHSNGNSQITGSLIVSGAAEFRGVEDFDTNVVIGKNATSTGQYSVVIGKDAGISSGGQRNIAIGESANLANNTSFGIVVGYGTDVTGTNGIAIGYLAQATANGISLGRSAEAASSAIAIGKGITANASQLEIGFETPTISASLSTGHVILSGSTGGLELIGSGSTMFEVIGSEGDLFTITDNLTTGSLFAVKDISGIPLLDVTANSTIPDVVTVGQSNLLLDSGSLEVIGSISASGDVTGRLQRPTQEFGTNFTASAEYSGYYLRTGGNVTCSIQANALPSINSEFDFFQTSSVGNMLFETGSTSVILNSKNNNLNLAGQFSSATLKYVGNNTFDLMGDLT